MNLLKNMKTKKFWAYSNYNHQKMDQQNLTQKMKENMTLDYQIKYHPKNIYETKKGKVVY